MPKSQMRSGSTTKSKVVGAAPGILIALYAVVGIFEGPIWERALYGAFFGAITQTLGLLGYVIAHNFAFGLLGVSKPDSPFSDAERPRILAALLLCAVVYIWLQAGSNTRFEQYEECVANWRGRYPPTVETALANCRETDSDDYYVE